MRLVVSAGKLCARLRERRAETLVETLVAVLLCGLAAALLMTSISVAGTLNQNARTITRQEELQGTNAARFYGYLKDDGEQIAASTGTVVLSDRANATLVEAFSGDNVKVFGGPLIVSYDVAEEH